MSPALSGPLLRRLLNPRQLLAALLGGALERDGGKEAAYEGGAHGGSAGGQTNEAICTYDLYVGLSRRPQTGQ